MTENPYNFTRNKLLAIKYYQNNNVSHTDVAKIIKLINSVGENVGLTADNQLKLISHFM